ncbi:NADP-dependent oxidoreductase [Marinobacteraceae bacterium S3BR75-40.1]
MRAVAFAAFGEADMLHLVESPLPEPAPGQVRVKVSSAGLNPIDWKTRRGLGFVADQIKGHLPWTPGFDIAGRVDAVGEGGTRWQPGDAVMGLIGFPLQGGGYASYALVEPQALVAAPDTLDLALAGGIPLAALTAWQGLYEQGGLEAGQKILIHAGAGGVGHFAVQIAKAADCHVIATASSHNADFLAELGADEVVDYTREDFVDVCYGLDCVLDLMGGEIGIRSLHCLSEHGVLVTVPTNTADQVKAAADELGLQARNFTVHADDEQLEEIAEMVDTGDIRLHVEAAYPLADAAAAHRRLEEGHVRGKLVLQP